MKKQTLNKILKSVVMTICVAFLFTSCSKKDEVDKNSNDKSIIPSSYQGRSVESQGTYYVSKKQVTLYVWDSGTIDGDIISLLVNGKVVLANYTLTGSKKPISVTLDYSGYNYILLFAHNEGSISPNTAALSIDDGKGEQDLILSADLQKNGACDVIVK